MQYEVVVKTRGFTILISHEVRHISHGESVIQKVRCISIFGNLNQH